MIFFLYKQRKKIMWRYVQEIPWVNLNVVHGQQRQVMSCVWGMREHTGTQMFNRNQLEINTKFILHLSSLRWLSRFHFGFQQMLVIDCSAVYWVYWFTFSLISAKDITNIFAVSVDELHFFHLKAYSLNILMLKYSYMALELHALIN